MGHQPARAVSRNIKLRHNANAAIASVSDDLSDLILRVIVAVRSKLMQLGKLLALDTKALILGEMPVKNIQLHRGHRVEIAFEHFHGLEVTSDVDQQAAPRKPRLIVDLNSPKKVPVAIGVD